MFTPTILCAKGADGRLYTLAAESAVGMIEQSQEAARTGVLNVGGLEVPVTDGVVVRPGRLGPLHKFARRDGDGQPLPGEAAAPMAAAPRKRTR